MSTTTDVADRFFAAIEAGDTDAVAAMYADGAVIWHNDDGVEQTREHNLRVLGWMVRRTTSRAYRHVRRFDIEGGFVQQHDLHLEFADGGSAVLPACVVVRLEGDRISRVDEYLDSAGVTAAFAPHLARNP